MIKIENLSKTFYDENNAIKALKNINLQINEGEIFGIIGLSGAGKSTLIRCINRLEEPTEGKIFIQGEDITAYDKEDLRKLRKNIGMIFQHFNLFLQKTVYKNIAFPLELEGLPKEEIEKRVDTLLDYVDLKDKKYAYPAQLSGGQKQRVAIARALANNPKILLSDEGTSALDPKTTKSILDLLRRTRDEFGLTIVLITHQMEVIKDICDRVAIIENGEIIELNTVEELFKNPKTKTAHEFISRIKSDITEEIIEPVDFSGTVVRLSYSGENAKKPIVSKMVKQFDIEVNILSGDINRLIKTNVGHLILELEGKDEEINKAIKYLKDNNVHVEVM
ncbi:MAG: methionine ABC transporter ATP-binding protein [Tissierellia bacterium]|nr:methionine ABC transporter ATP-binding protein [Tissierellia bacterium]